MHVHLPPNEMRCHVPDHSSAIVRLGHSLLSQGPRRTAVRLARRRPEYHDAGDEAKRGSKRKTNGKAQ